ncbi:hypothetical protein NN561_006317 [Cricetulus griseus]
MLRDGPSRGGRPRAKEIPHIPGRRGGCRRGEPPQPGPCLDSRILIWAAGGLRTEQGRETPPPPPIFRVTPGAGPPPQQPPSVACATPDGTFGPCASVFRVGLQKLKVAFMVRRRW